MTSLPGDSDNSSSVRLPDTTQAQYLVCARCGIPADGPRPTWTCSVENGLHQYFCDSCARANITAIEARVDSTWW